MKHKILLALPLLSMTLMLTACDDLFEIDDDSTSSVGSSSSSFTLKPKTHNASYASSCHTQTASQYQAADIRYNQYSECMTLYNGDPQCNGYYTNYLTQVELAEESRAALGC